MNKSRLKFITYYLLQFLKTINITIVLVLIILESTVLNYRYINKKMTDNNYYQLLYENMENQMDDILIPSGFDISIIEKTFTLEEITKTEQKVIHDFYNNINTPADSTQFKERLKQNIDADLEKKHLVAANEKDITNLITELSKIYENNIYYNNYLNSSRAEFNKAKHYVNIILTISILSLLSLILLLQIFHKRRDKMSIPLIANGLIFITTYIYLKSNLSIEHLFLYSKGLSVLITEILNDLFIAFLTIAIVSIIIGFANRLIYFKKVLKHKKKKKKEEYTYEEDSN